MALQITTDYQIALGHNNQAGLALVTSLSDALGVAFLEPRGITEDDPGSEQPSPGGGYSLEGLPTTQWVSVITLEQYKYLWDTFINVATRGAVTIRTPAINDTSFVDYNTWLRIPKRRELSLSYTRFISGDFSGMGWSSPMIWSYSWMVELAPLP